jgi:RND family efflux transporter MFP subunit
MVSVTTKFTGYVEKVHVHYLGQPGKKGDPLFEIYSPELVQTEQELLSAIEYVAALENAPEEARTRARSLLEAARTRLRYWDISAEQITRLERTREAFRTMTMVAPASGVVMKRQEGLEGMGVKPGMDLIHIADLSSLWLTVEVFDDQLPWVETGGEATISLTYFPGETFRARVKYVEPRIAEETRTVRLTLEAPNPDGKLRAGMYATVEFDPVVATNALAVPAQSVIRTGRRTLVIVDLGGGRFAPREIVLGPESDDYVVAVSGLTDGERIVTSAQFLIDSESNIQAAIQKMIAERSQRN